MKAKRCGPGWGQWGWRAGGALEARTARVGRQRLVVCGLHAYLPPLAVRPSAALPPAFRPPPCALPPAGAPCVLTYVRPFPRQQVPEHQALRQRDGRGAGALLRPVWQRGGHLRGGQPGGCVERHVTPLPPKPLSAFCVVLCGVGGEGPDVFCVGCPPAPSKLQFALCALSETRRRGKPPSCSLVLCCVCWW